MNILKKLLACAIVFISVYGNAHAQAIYNEPNLTSAETANLLRSEFETKLHIVEKNNTIRNITLAFIAATGFAVGMESYRRTKYKEHELIIYP